jgi:hypothetical protein
LDTFACNGSIFGNIDKRQRWINVRVSHENHDRPIPQDNNLVPEEVRQFIRENAVRMTAPQLFQDVCFRFGLMVTRAQVYHWRQESIEPLYWRAREQMVSARLFLRERQSQGFEEVCHKYS